MIKLDIGVGGRRHGPDFIGIDKFPGKEVDLVFDLEKIRLDARLPYDDSSVDEIWCSHTLEHIDCVVKVMNEFHRVLKNKPNGKATIIVPHAGSWAAFANPTHKAFFVPETFRRYFASDKLEENQKLDLSMYEVKPWHIEKLEWTQGGDFNIKKEIVVIMMPLKPEGGEK